jgi:hypothetical protein
MDPDTEQPAATLELATPLLEDAVAGHIDGIIGDTDPFVAVREAVASTGTDEIIVSTLPARVSHWLRQDLPRRAEQFGSPVTVVTAQQSKRAVCDRPERPNLKRARHRPTQHRAPEIAAIRQLPLTGEGVAQEGSVRAV